MGYSIPYHLKNKHKIDTLRRLRNRSGAYHIFKYHFETTVPLLFLSCPFPTIANTVNIYFRFSYLQSCKRLAVSKDHRSQWLTDTCRNYCMSKHKLSLLFRFLFKTLYQYNEPKHVGRRAWNNLIVELVFLTMVVGL